MAVKNKNLDVAKTPHEIASEAHASMMQFIEEKNASVIKASKVFVENHKMLRSAMLEKKENEDKALHEKIENERQERLDKCQADIIKAQQDFEKDRELEKLFKIARKKEMMKRLS
jgi:hypothetical protein